MVAGVGLGTALAIAFVRVRGRGFTFFGNISYSLYLLHVPVGGRVINLSLRLTDSPAGKVAALAVALSLSVAASYAFYRLIEKPAQRWSSAIPFGARRRAPALVVGPVAV